MDDQSPILKLHLTNQTSFCVHLKSSFNPVLIPYIFYTLHIDLIHFTFYYNPTSLPKPAPKIKVTLFVHAFTAEMRTLYPIPGTFDSIMQRLCVQISSGYSQVCH